MVGPVKAGATLPVKFSLCDSEGSNVSAASLAVHALGVTRESDGSAAAFANAGQSNAGNDFRFTTIDGAGAYIFNLKTTGLTPGAYVLEFSVGDDPRTYEVRFDVR